MVVCTRFATELVLRRDENAGVKVSIIPGSDRDDHEKQRLSEFNREVDMNSPDIAGLIEEAKQVMGLSQTKVFSSDVLRVEFQGVNQPHLTLVDLPGLFRAGSREQSEHEAPIEPIIALIEIHAALMAKHLLINFYVREPPLPDLCGLKSCNSHCS